MVLFWKTDKMFKKLLNRSFLARFRTELTVHAVDRHAPLLGYLLHIAPSHLQPRMPELRLDVPRLAMLLEVRRAGPPKRLVRQVRDTSLLCQRLPSPAPVLSEPLAAFFPAPDATALFPHRGPVRSQDAGSPGSRAPSAARKRSNVNWCVLIG